MLAVNANNAYNYIHAYRQTRIQTDVHTYIVIYIQPLRASLVSITAGAGVSSYSTYIHDIM